MDNSNQKNPPGSSGGDNDYYVVKIKHSKRFSPCTIECEDVIRALNLDFFEGEAFKSIWRKATDRLGNGKPGDSALRNAQKVQHYGSRMVDHEIYLADNVDEGPLQVTWNYSPSFVPRGNKL